MQYVLMWGAKVHACRSGPKITQPLQALVVLLLVLLQIPSYFSIIRAYSRLGNSEYFQLCSAQRQRHNWVALFKDRNAIERKNLVCPPEGRYYTLIQSQKIGKWMIFWDKTECTDTMTLNRSVSTYINKLSLFCGYCAT